MAQGLSNDGAGARKPSFNDMELDETGFASEYSKDYWDLVFEQLGKRTLFKVGVVTLLYGVAIFAPVIANDRSLKVESVDLKGYGALRILRPMATTANRLPSRPTRPSPRRSPTRPPTRRPPAPRRRGWSSRRPGCGSGPCAPCSRRTRQAARRVRAALREGRRPARRGGRAAAAAEFGEAKTVARAARRTSRP